MEPIVWSENFSVGVTLFDRQHQRLIAMINELIKNPMTTARSETVADILTGLTRYALEHFKAEERLMIEHGYPHLEQHKLQHQAFWEKVTELSMAATEGLEQVPQALTGFLQQWLTQHILIEDMAYKSFFGYPESPSSNDG